MKKLLAVFCLLLCLLLTGCAMLQEVDQPSAAPAAEGTEEPTAAPEPEHAQAYLVVTVANAVYEPIPLTGAGRYTVSRGEYVNVIEVTETSICMAESSCDNQDCVYQGVVDLDNKGDRVLQNMIICLPNEVMLELYTYEELQVALPGWQEGQE